MGSNPSQKITSLRILTLQKWLFWGQVQTPPWEGPRILRAKKKTSNPKFNSQNSGSLWFLCVGLTNFQDQKMMRNICGGRLVKKPPVPRRTQCFFSSPRTKISSFSFVWGEFGVDLPFPSLPGEDLLRFSRCLDGIFFGVQKTPPHVFGVWKPRDYYWEERKTQEKNLLFKTTQKQIFIVPQLQTFHPRFTHPLCGFEKNMGETIKRSLNQLPSLKLT